MSDEADSYFVGRCNQREILRKWCNDRIDAMLARPQMWAFSPASFEEQIMTLVEIRNFGLNMTYPEVPGGHYVILPVCPDMKGADKRAVTKHALNSWQDEERVKVFLQTLRDFADRPVPDMP